MSRIDYAPRPYISAKYLLAEPPPATTVVPPNFHVERYPAGKRTGTFRQRGGVIVGSTAPRSCAMATSRR